MSLATVNWTRIAAAIEYYVGLGYKYVESPWLVSKPTYDVTKPPGAPDFTTPEGYLVASGEQSLLELLNSGQRFGHKVVCCTPCFRIEPDQIGNELHQLHFMKVELMCFPGNYKDIYRVIKDAFKFYSSCSIPCNVIGTGRDTYDIVGLNSKIELGSYGYRKWEETGITWVYGTGLAEPRTSQVEEAEKQFNK